MAKKRAHRPDGYSPAPPPTPSGRGPTPGSTQPPTRRPARRTASQGHRTPAGSAPARSSARAPFEDASRPVLVRMARLPNFVVPMLMGVLLFLGLAIPAPWAGALLVADGLFLSWLTAVSWPAITPGSRTMRVAVDLGVLGLGVAKLLGRI